MCGARGGQVYRDLGVEPIINATGHYLTRLGGSILSPAVNAAMDDLRSQTAQAAPAAMDPTALAGMLENLQAESVRQMSRFSDGIAETVAKINSAASGGAGRGR